MYGNVKIQFLTGTVRLEEPEYAVQSPAGLSDGMRFGLGAAGIRVVKDTAVPPGVMECRIGGRVISILQFDCTN